MTKIRWFVCLVVGGFMGYALHGVASDVTKVATKLQQGAAQHGS